MKNCIILFVVFNFFNSNLMGQNPLNPKGDSLYINIVTLNKLVSSYEDTLKNGYYNNLNIKDKILIVMIQNTIDRTPNLSKQSIYLNFYSYITKFFLNKLLTDLEFNSFDRKVYYSEKYDITYGGIKISDRYILVDSP